MDISKIDTMEKAEVIGTEAQDVTPVCSQWQKCSLMLVLLMVASIGGGYVIGRNTTDCNNMVTPSLSQKSNSTFIDTGSPTTSEECGKLFPWARSSCASVSFLRGVACTRDDGTFCRYILGDQSPCDTEMGQVCKLESPFFELTRVDLPASNYDFCLLVERNEVGFSSLGAYVLSPDDFWILSEYEQGYAEDLDRKCNNDRRLISSGQNDRKV